MFDFSRKRKVRKILSNIRRSRTPDTVTAREELVSMGEAAVKFLLPALQDDSPQVRRFVIGVLGAIGDDRAVGPLATVLAEDPNRDIRRLAAIALGAIGEAGAITSLVDTLSDLDDMAVQMAVAEGLATAGDRSMTPLLVALKGDDKAVRQVAARALTRIGEPAVTPLIAVLEDEANSPAVRGTAAVTLGQIGHRRAIKPLTEMLGAADTDVRYGAAMGLELFESAAAFGPDTVSKLIAVLADDDARVRLTAADVLGHVGGERATDALVQVLYGNDPDLAARAAFALAKVGTPEAVSAVEKWRKG